MLNIYYAKTEPLRNKKIYEKGLMLLPAERLEKLARIKTEETRLGSMAAGLLQQYGLNRAGVPTNEVVMEKNSDGKPYLVTHPEIFFNLSHSGDYVAVAISDKEVGIDIEKLRAGKRKLAERFFSEEECKHLEAEWSDEAFTRIWTRKESYIKAIGMGMRMPLCEFSTLEDVVNGYYLASFRLVEPYWLTVCREGEPVRTTPQEIFLDEILDW